MTSPDGPDQPAPARARPYAWTDGRTRPTADLAIEAMVHTTPAGNSLPYRRASPQSAVTRLCTVPHSIAEVGAHLGVPLGVARVLVSDLLEEGLVTVQTTTTDTDDWYDRHELLERVLDGLRAL